MDMVVRHQCIEVEDGDRVIITTFDGQQGPSRRVCWRDWVDIVVPNFVKCGAVRVSHIPGGECVWQETIG